MTLLDILADRTGIMVGQVLPFAGSAAPGGYLLCDGSAVSRTTYKALFNAISTTFGAGDGSTTFNLPKSDGLFLQSSGSQVLSGDTYDGSTLGTKAGHTTGKNGLSASTTSTPTTTTVNDTNLAHTHSLTDFYGQGTGNVDPGGATTTMPGGSNATSNQSDNTGSALTTHSHTATYGVTHSTSLSSSDTETAPAAVSVNFIIKF